MMRKWPFKVQTRNFTTRMSYLTSSWKQEKSTRSSNKKFR